MFSNRAIIKDFNFLTDKRVEECSCKFRYRSTDIPCTVNYLDDNTIEVIYKNGKSVTPGQFCVLYDNELCLGGGIIDQVFK